VNDARVPSAMQPDDDPFENLDAFLVALANLTCTRTVSPDFIAGFSVSCDFSTSSIAPIMPSVLQFSKYAPLFLVQGRAGQQVGAPCQGPADCFPLAPSPDLGVVAR